MLLMMPSTKIAQMGFLRRKRVARALDKKYLLNDISLTTGPNSTYNFTEMFLIIDQNAQLG